MKNKAVLWTIIIAVLSVSVLAQTGIFLRSAYSYGDKYTPFLAEDLRLYSQNLTPSFKGLEYTEVVDAMLVTGSYLNLMDTVYPSIPKNMTTARSFVINKSLSICSNETGTAQETCLRFYGNLGQRKWELSLIPTYNICRGNIQSSVLTVNEQIYNKTYTKLQGTVQFSVLATALKWCQIHFNENITVVEPTKENTNNTAPDWWITEHNSTSTAINSTQQETTASFDWKEIIAYVLIAVIVFTLIYLFVIKPVLKNDLK